VSIADLFRGAHLRRIKRPTVDPLDEAIQAIESRIDRIDPAPVDPIPVDPVAVDQLATVDPIPVDQVDPTIARRAKKKARRRAKRARMIAAASRKRNRTS
jgi:hypothetical protein